jgi:hypothetical protein
MFVCFQEFQRKAARKQVEAKSVPNSIPARLDVNNYKRVSCAPFKPGYLELFPPVAAKVTEIAESIGTLSGLIASILMALDSDSWANLGREQCTQSLCSKTLRLFPYTTAQLYVGPHFSPRMRL